MTGWRNKAGELLPELSASSATSWSVHVFFAELVDLVLVAHRGDDVDRLRRAYDFASWCLEQPSRFLSDAAILSFYEHLFDDWDLRFDVVTWLPDGLALRLRPLLQWRLPAPRLVELDRLLGCDPSRRNPSRVS
ncbi:MAG: DUF7674 family protein [Sciscionella sp.]